MILEETKYKYKYVYTGRWQLSNLTVIQREKKINEILNSFGQHGYKLKFTETNDKNDIRGFIFEI